VSVRKKMREKHGKVRERRGRCEWVVREMEQERYGGREGEGDRDGDRDGEEEGDGDGDGKRRRRRRSTLRGGDRKEDGEAGMERGREGGREEGRAAVREGRRGGDGRTEGRRRDRGREGGWRGGGGQKEKGRQALGGRAGMQIQHRIYASVQFRLGKHVAYFTQLKGGDGDSSTDWYPSPHLRGRGKGTPRKGWGGA
jgi:hypothetical protein